MVRFMAREPADQQEAIIQPMWGCIQGMNQVPRGLETTHSLPYIGGEESVMPPTATTKHYEMGAPAGGPR